MLCWRFANTTHFQIYNVCFVGSSRCCVRGLPCATHVQTYVLLELKHVVLEAYHTHALSRYVVCKSLSPITMLVVHTHMGILNYTIDFSCGLGLIMSRYLIHPRS